MPPINTSPMIAWPSSPTMLILPGVCPGVWIISAAMPNLRSKSLWLPFIIISFLKSGKLQQARKQTCILHWIAYASGAHMLVSGMNNGFNMWVQP